MSNLVNFEENVTDEMTIVLVGNPGVGKTSLVRNISMGAFNDQYFTTIGVDYDSRILEIDGSFIKFHIWDSSGQQGFMYIARKYLATADGVMLMYDVTNKKSFKDIPDWIDLVNRCVADKNLPKILVGNKLDMRHKKAITASHAKEFAIPNGMHHVEASSQTGKGVNVAFYVLANSIRRHRKLGTVERIGYPTPAIDYHEMQIHDEPSVVVDDGPEYTHLFKILLLGDSRVGKSAIRYRFCRDHYTPQYYETAGFDYSTRTILIDGERIKIQVWDIAGDNVYAATRKGYYRGANAFIFVYDISNMESFDKVDMLLKELDMYEQSAAPKVVVGNKSDLAHKRKVSVDEAMQWADGWRIPAFESSAKTGKAMDSPFLKVCMALKRDLAPWKRVYDFDH